MQCSNSNLGLSPQSIQNQLLFITIVVDKRKQEIDQNCHSINQQVEILTICNADKQQ